MGSLKDYGRYQAAEAPKRKKVGRRLLYQTLLAAVFFLAVVAGITAENRLGDGARYVLGTAVSAESSWVEFRNAAATPAAEDAASATDGDSAAAEGTAGETAPSLVESDATPQFTAPASGVVVTDLAVAASGFSTQQGILIQGAAGQDVKAAAEAEVGYLGESEDGFIVELLHSGGFTSIYQGLSEISVAAGDRIAIGDVIGVTASGELTFSLLLDDQEVDPLDYLFQ